MQKTHTLNERVTAGREIERRTVETVAEELSGPPQGKRRRISTKEKKTGISKRSVTCSFCFKKGHTKRICERKRRHDLDPDSYMASCSSEEKDEMVHEVLDADEEDAGDTSSVSMAADGDMDAEEADGDVNAEESDNDVDAE